MLSMPLRSCSTPWLLSVDNEKAYGFEFELLTLFVIETYKANEAAHEKRTKTRCA